jgi:DNA-binding transcriptional MerR regulator
MRIGEVASRTGVTTKTIRFWESTGLLAEPARTPSGYRDYGPEAIDRLKFIRHSQSAGLTVEEIRQVLAISDDGRPPCEHVGELIHRHLSDLDQRIGELTDIRRRLRRLAQRAANQDPATCGGYCSILQTKQIQRLNRDVSIASLRSAGGYMASLMPLRMSHTLVGQAVK